MKKIRLALLTVVVLLAVAVPLYAQDAGLTLEGLATKVEAMVELVATMTERLASYEERLAVLEATATPTETPTPSPTSPPTATPTPTSQSPTVTISRTMNVRAGPGTNYPVLGQASPGQQFPISGKNPAGGWWQIIYGGQYAWVYSPLVTATNPELVQVAPVIPTPPPTPVPTATPIPPTPVPPTPVPQPVTDPCAGIGGDGCKFRLRNTDLRNNGGGELKLFVGFVHEGRGDEVQGIGGSYYVELHKDGVHVSAVNNSTRGGNSTHQGPQGNKYNYLKAVPLGQLPGGNVAGNYTIFVRDGNGERDSQNYYFSISGGNGEVWLIFAQNN
ncbi:MAG: SH3 domain-containing protein [Caldilineaceae bacterium SB0670_bin_27]|uniref:SH3 domain-containing protein n=1 Tax=Caldilineaceae bacterium SB0664_bin_27 TaxID=2605260 RepID=A0A6B0YYU8_9CHLR|nr:SH3 domain-containing protein [Caldilineaceae bacterium SB0664_bin_27]MYJ78812.1 SH3 domain-containing protein [Caldilineaceae bacterium SB0670_bin_27]